MYSCCCVDHDYDSAIKCFEPEVRKARRTYRCSECEQPINPGEKYEHVSVLETDMPPGKMWFTHRTCWFCMKIREDFFNCGWAYGGVRADFYECQGWDYLGIWPDQGWADDD